MTAPDEESSPPGEPRPIKTYSLEEVVEMVLPLDMTNAVRWLQTQLLAGKASGYKAGRKWRMTHSDVEDFIARHRNSPRPLPSAVLPQPDYGGLTRRSWLYHQGRSGLRRRDPRTTTTPGSTSSKLPRDLPIVHAESPDVIAKMPNLTGTQEELHERLQQDGHAVVDGKYRKTVEALARRGLATYTADYVPNENKDGYIYRFTIRPT